LMSKHSVVIPTPADTKDEDGEKDSYENNDSDGDISDDDDVFDSLKTVGVDEKSPAENKKRKRANSTPEPQKKHKHPFLSKMKLYFHFLCPLIKVGCSTKNYTIERNNTLKYRRENGRISSM